MDSGKLFEKDFKDSCLLEDTKISIDRLYDPVGGFKGVRNICDFICYKFPYEYYLELKSHKGKSFPISGITETQYDGLLLKQPIEGVTAGVIIKYSDYDVAYFVPIFKIRGLVRIGHKSISIEAAKALGVEMQGRKKRVTFQYDVLKLFNDIGGMPSGN